MAEEKQNSNIHLNSAPKAMEENTDEKFILKEIEKVTNIVEPTTKKSIFFQIDQALNRYYESIGVFNYLNERGIGKFMEFTIVNELQEDDIEHELQNVQNCLYVEFDQNFPFNGDGSTKQQFIFDLIKQCYNDIISKHINLQQQIDSSISQDMWLQLLLLVDEQIVKYYDIKDILIFCSPYKIAEIHNAVQQSYELSFCADDILDFLIFGYIANKRLTNYDYIYDSLLSKQAIIIINIKSNNVITLPRNLDQSFLSIFSMQFKYSSILIDFMKKYVDQKSVQTQQQQQHQNRRSSTDCNDISNCAHLNRLIQSYQQYFQRYLVHSSATIKSYKQGLNYNCTADFTFNGKFAKNELIIYEANRDYSHLQKHHKDHNSYLFILHKLGGFCDNDNCSILQTFHHSVNHIGSGPISHQEKRSHYAELGHLQQSRIRFDHDIIMERVHSFYQHRSDKKEVIIFVDPSMYGSVACTASNERIITDTDVDGFDAEYIVEDEKVDTQNNEDVNEILCNSSRRIICNNIHDCEYLKRLQETMLSYNNTSDYNYSHQILNDYLHLISYHNDDPSFKVIYDKMGGFCDIKDCQLIQKNKMTCLSIDNLMLQMVRRIHRYYCHSYDYGCRLTNKERQIIEDIDRKADDSKDEITDEYLINKQLLQLNKILNNKQCDRTRLTRFNTTETNEVKIDHEKVKKKSNQRQRENSKGLYSFGYIFDYPYHPGLKSYESHTPNHLKEEHQWLSPSICERYHASYCTDSAFQHDYKHRDWISRYIGEVKPKFNDLKQELTNNALCVLNINAFNQEYKKAEMHYQSDYCKVNIRNNQSNDDYQEYDYYEYTDEYKNIDTYEEGFDSKGHHYAGWVRRNCRKKIRRKSAKPYPDQFYYYRRRNISIQDILTVMVYCNYTQLQCEFTKTFRKINENEKYDVIAARHSNFYWFGKYLKETVNWFGERDVCGNMKSLYHGIGEKLTFPSVIGLLDGIRIYGPLSTTTSLEVAINFTNNNNGLIVDFGHGHERSRGTYFSCAWLSNYPYEQEHLFVQNEHGYFKFDNIKSATFGVEYGVIIKAFRILKMLINWDSTHPLLYLFSKIGCVEEICEDDLLNKLREIFGIRTAHDRMVMMNIIDRMIQHRLYTVNKQKYSKYNVFSGLTDYGQKLLEQFCANQSYVNVFVKLFDRVGAAKLIHYFYDEQLKVNCDLIKDIFADAKQITRSKIMRIEDICKGSVVGWKLDVRRSTGWCKAVIKEIRPYEKENEDNKQLETPKEIFIHYIGVDRKCDEWIVVDSENILCSCWCVGKCDNTHHRIADPATQSELS